MLMPMLLLFSSSILLSVVGECEHMNIYTFLRVNFMGRYNFFSIFGYDEKKLLHGVSDKLSNKHSESIKWLGSQRKKKSKRRDICKRGDTFHFIRFQMDGNDVVHDFW